MTVRRRRSRNASNHLAGGALLDPSPNDVLAARVDRVLPRKKARQGPEEAWRARKGEEQAERGEGPVGAFWVIAERIDQEERERSADSCFDLRQEDEERKIVSGAINAALEHIIVDNVRQDSCGHDESSSPITPITA